MENPRIMRKVINAFRVDLVPVQCFTFAQKRRALKDWRADDLRRFANDGIYFIVNDDHDYFELNEFLQPRQYPEKYELAGVIVGYHATSAFTWDELIINNGDADKCILLQCLN